MQLREAHRDDLPFILDLERKYSERGFVGSDPPEVHARQMAARDCRYYVIELDRSRFGYIILRGLTSPNRSIELKRVVVKEPGRGIGGLALREVLGVAFGTLLAHRVWLDVYADNERARRVYRRLGFVEEGILRDCIKVGDSYRSLVVMSILEAERNEQLPNLNSRSPFVRFNSTL
jgi:diamine N-acetyltransferase